MLVLYSGAGSCTQERGLLENDVALSTCLRKYVCKMFCHLVDRRPAPSGVGHGDDHAFFQPDCSVIQKIQKTHFVAPEEIATCVLTMCLYFHNILLFAVTSHLSSLYLPGQAVACKDCIRSLLEGDRVKTC